MKHLTPKENVTMKHLTPKDGVDVTECRLMIDDFGILIWKKMTPQ